MFSRILLINLILTLTPFASLAQAKDPQPTKAPQPPSSAQEFPVILQQGVTAGKTPVGTKITAKLVVATLHNGKVIPKSAVFSGQIVESVAKTSTDPSRLAIRMDTAEWKNGSAPVTAYFTGWYYPALTESGQNLQYGPTLPANRTWDGQGQYPDPNSKVYRPFPGSDSGKDTPVPDTPNAVTGNHRVPMKDMASEPLSGGGIALVCKHSNIKLDKLTIYVFAGIETTPAK